VIVALYGLGLLAGAAVTAMLLWLIGVPVRIVPTPASLALLIVACSIAALRDAEVVRFQLPQNGRLVPREVFQLPEPVAALQFGLEMGTGCRTFVTASAPYLLVLFLLFGLASISDAVAIAVGFAAGRWLMMLGVLLRKSTREWSTSGCIGRPYLVVCIVVTTIGILPSAISNSIG
jgi:hypothetical protein